MVTTTIYVKPYLAAYMYVRYQNSVVTEFNAIRLKSIENLYHVIKNLTAKRPRNVSWRETGNLTLIIPDPRYGKDPETYNYLGHDSIIIIEEEIETINSGTASCIKNHCYHLWINITSTTNTKMLS